jgi:uncharacterized protein YeaO (DUF488 family)
MPILTKRWDDPKEPGDGWRVLVCRYRPRGVRKEEETWDQWRPELGPSKELHALVYGKVGAPISWSTYRAQYVREMREQKEAIVELARRAAAGETITLLCSSACVDERRCHRSLLKELIDRQVEQNQPSR